MKVINYKSEFLKLKKEHDELTIKYCHLSDIHLETTLRWFEKVNSLLDKNKELLNKIEAKNKGSIHETN